jgi:hypothetical protein
MFCGKRTSMYGSFPHAVRYKAHAWPCFFGLRVKAMLLAQCKLFYVKEFLITDYSKAFQHTSHGNQHNVE